MKFSHTVTSLVPASRTLISAIEKFRAGSGRANVYSRRGTENIIQDGPEGRAISEVTTLGFRKANAAEVPLRLVRCPCPTAVIHHP
jgi:hypothetical protein